jgi:sugar lactone lactonase YvrE
MILFRTGAAAAFLVALSAGAETLFVAAPLTSSEFTAGIEGPACDREGNVYCVSLREARNLARVTPEGRAEIFLALPDGSTGNGIRFGRDGKMFVADYTGHNVLRVDPKTRAVSVFVHEPAMNQPNDLAMALDGTLYASDPNWKEGAPVSSGASPPTGTLTGKRPGWAPPMALRSVPTARRSM